MWIKRAKPALAVTMGAGLLALSSVAHAATTDLPSQEEMWKIIQEQQKQIKALLNQQAKTERKVEATADQVAKVEKTASAFDSYGASDGPGWWKNTSIGGYGELHYNNGDVDEIDFHRFVLFFGHEFTDRIRLFSELELEHALSGEGQNGEVELEQAYIEFDIDEAANHRAKAGVFLIPTGILNEHHEPNTFFGVERNNVEKNIIPSTWWEGGLALSSNFDNGISTDLAFHSGLQVPTAGGNAFKIRNGRQKVSEASAKDPAVTGRVKWTGEPGVELSVSAQWQGDVTQGTGTETAQATLFEAHADIRKGPFGFRALGARWDIDSSQADAVGRDVQQGWYVEPAYYFDSEYGEWGIFSRYVNFDNEAGDNTDSQVHEYVAGINFWPHPDVVLKADYQIVDSDIGADDKIINLGVGYQF